MNELSSKYFDVVREASGGDVPLMNATGYLEHLSSQTSSYCYWGPGQWTGYGRKLCRRAKDILNHDF